MVPARPPRNAPASSPVAAALWLLTGVWVVDSGVLDAGVRPALGSTAPAPPWQPPEQPPESPPGQSSGEQEETQGAEPPVGAEAPAEEGASGETPAGEIPGEAAPDGSGGADGEEVAEEDEDPGRRAPEVVTAPVGILPGRLVATPSPAPGASIIGMILEDDGFFLHAAGGEVIAYEPDGRSTRWGLPGADAAFVAEHSGNIVLLDGSGHVALRRISDGVRVGGFSTGFAPDRGRLAGLASESPPGPRPGSEPGPHPEREPESEPGPNRGPASAALADGVLYWVSAGALRGYRIPAGDLVLEAELPEGEASSVVVGAAGEDSPSDLPPILLVSLGGGGAAAVGSTPGTTRGAVRWQVTGAGPVIGPALVFPAEGLVFFGDEGGDLTAVDLETGRERWRWKLAEGFRHPPLLSRGRLYAATKANSLYCFDARRGGERWRAALPGRPAAPPLRIAGAILVVTQDGLLVEVNGETGARIGSPRDLESEILGVVRRVGDGAREEGWRDRRLFLGLRDGRLAVFGPRIGGEAP